jgi:hypothetical protein
MAIQEANKLWGISFEPLEERTGPQLGIPHVPHGDFSGWQTVPLDNDTAYRFIVDQVLREILFNSPANNAGIESASSIRAE